MQGLHFTLAEINYLEALNMPTTPTFRFRRLRRTPALRDLVRETQFSLNDLIFPIFVEEKISVAVPISSMKGVYRHPENSLGAIVSRVWNKGIKAILLFGISHNKDEKGSDTWNEQGLMARMIKIAKQAQPNMIVITDNCFCEYTTHGFCGVLTNRDTDNDATLENLQKQVVVAATAGVDIIAPSGMVDGMVAAIRSALDTANFSHIPIMSYSTKFASAFYGPFRDAVDSTFKGTRSSYQIDPANGREALAESLQDEAEGADILMVKPGTLYLDVIANIRTHSHLPLAAYHVSGEYAMIKTATAAGCLNERDVVMETMTAFKRAGADLIITYYAEQISDWLNADK